jgi:hypothetical protein
MVPCSCLEISQVQVRTGKIRSHSLLPNLTHLSQTLKLKKPTGDGEGSPLVNLAHEVEQLNNEKSETRDIDDDELASIDGAVEIETDAKTKTVPPPEAYQD